MLAFLDTFCLQLEQQFLCKFEIGIWFWHVGVCVSVQLVSLAVGLNGAEGCLFLLNIRQADGVEPYQGMACSSEANWPS